MPAATWSPAFPPPNARLAAQAEKRKRRGMVDRSLRANWDQGMDSSKRSFMNDCMLHGRTKAARRAR